MVNCCLNSISIGLLLGAKVSILNSKVYFDALAAQPPLQPPVIALRTYSGSSIPCLGCVTLNVELNGAVLRNFRFYVTEQGVSIMGVDLFDAFRGSVLLGGDRLVSSSSSATTPSKHVCVTADESGRFTVSLEQFSVLLKKSGRLTGFMHRPMIDESVKPVRQKFWHPPLAKREPIANELRRLEQEGVIERVDASPWTSNIVTAKKRDGSLRLCVNLSDVNKAIIPDTYPLPTMDELTERIAGSTVFSKVDLLWGYLQLELAEDRRYLTSFVTHEGVYRFRSLPFGLASGPSAFHQVIRKILDGLDGCVSILDDIL